MPTTHTTATVAPAARKGAVMAASETTSETVARLRAQGWSASRILSGLGHPGYGAAFARQAIERIERFDMTAHEAVYGGRSADRKVYEVTGR
jgi:hypothetical protein